MCAACLSDHANVVSNRIRDEGCESDQLRKDPIAFVTQKYADAASIPTHLVLFSDLARGLDPFLTQHGFVLVRSCVVSIPATMMM